MVSTQKMAYTPDSAQDGATPRLAYKEGTVPWDSIIFGAPEPWVEEVPHHDNVAAKDGAHLTYLLLARQTNAEAARAFHGLSYRLETALAVQNQSQWSLNLDPRFQTVTLHWLRTVRAGLRIDHLKRDRMRLVQRETQLEHQVINGSWTLITVLDDVRVGDVVEVGYTYESHHPIAEGWSEVFFSIPRNLVVGTFRNSVLFRPSNRTMQSMASADAPVRQETVLADGTVKWWWEGSQPEARDIEPNVPTSHYDFIWVQASDVGPWNRIAARVAGAWNTFGDGGDLDGWPEFSAPAELNGDAIAGLIRHIQDEFRYLSVDLDTGGWIPAAPAAVARQRRGDCKDLVWLAHAVLKRWGVKSRPILVGAGARERVGSLLPMTLLFNHAVVEVDFQGERRWFDLTMRSQGGDYASQPVSWFHYGLPVDASATQLEAQPGKHSPNLSSFREVIYVDTRKDAKTAVELRFRAEGVQAEVVRRSFVALGAEGFAVDRLKLAAKRYGKVQRLGSIQWRDDRRANVFEIAEGFEISECVYGGERNERALYDVPPSFAAIWFIMPDDRPRRCPWAMPYPLEIRHSVKVRSASMGLLDDQKAKWVSSAFTALLDKDRRSQEWTNTVHFTVNTPEIAADQVAAYRTHLMDFCRAASWRLYLSWGRARPDAFGGFGQLPDPARGVVAYVGPADISDYPDAKLGEHISSAPVPLIIPWWRRGLFRRPMMRRDMILLVWFAVIVASGITRTFIPNGSQSYAPPPRFESRSQEPGSVLYGAPRPEYRLIQDPRAPTWPAPGSVQPFGVNPRRNLVTLPAPTPVNRQAGASDASRLQAVVANLRALDSAARLYFTANNVSTVTFPILMGAPSHPEISPVMGEDYNPIVFRKGIRTQIRMPDGMVIWSTLDSGQ